MQGTVMPGIEHSVDLFRSRSVTLRQWIEELRGVEPGPRISREGIRWSGGAGGRPLEVALAFDNPGPRATRRVEARIEIARFGAFVPGEPLTTLVVPSIPSGGRWTFRTAIGSGDLPPWALAGGSGPVSTLRLMRDLFQPETTAMEHQGFHFIGNLNVFVARTRPVERHMARAVKLKPGALNFGLFLVGDGRAADYRFQVAACEPGWRMELQPFGWDTPARISTTMVRLDIVPPSGAESGRASVLVERLSTSESAQVEFELDVRAGGSKCYSF